MRRVPQQWLHPGTFGFCSQNIKTPYPIFTLTRAVIVHKGKNTEWVPT